jgi:phage protein D
MAMAIASGTRAPRAWISLNGTKLLCTEASVTLQSTGASSSFTAEVPLDLLLSNGWTMSSLAQQKEVTGAVYISNDINSDPNGVQLIIGQVDNIDVNLPAMSVTIAGRDMSSKMHNNLNYTQYLNQTSSQIVNTIAGNYGLNLSGTSQGMVGKQYTKDYVKMFDGESDWTAVQNLAQLEGYAAYIQGGTSTLYFGPPGQGGSYSVNYQPPTPGSPASGDFLSLLLSQNLNLTSTVIAKASSFDPRQGTTVTAEKMSSHGGGGSIIYEKRASNMTQEQVQKLANTTHDMSVRHETEIEAELVGDNSLLAGMSLQVAGTQSAWDNSYSCDTVHHEVSELGYLMTVVGRAPSSAR